MIARTSGAPVSITGLGCYVPERVVTNEDLAQIVETSDEWIRDRTGIRERRIAAPEEAMSDLALPAARRALQQAGVAAHELDMIIVATVTPDMAFPATAALLADRLGAHAAAAYDLSAGCTGFMYALAQAHAVLAAGLARRALVVGGDVLSRVLDWTDRSTLVLFGDGAGAVVIEHTDAGGFIGFELGADGSGGSELLLPGSGSRAFPGPHTLPREERAGGLQVRDEGYGELGRGGSRGLREDRRRRRCLRSPPGERPDHRPRCAKARLSRGEGRGKR